MLLEQGRLLMATDRDPIPSSRAAALLVGERVKEVETEEDRRAWTRFWRYLAATALIPCAAILAIVFVVSAGVLGR